MSQMQRLSSSAHWAQKKEVFCDTQFDCLAIVRNRSSCGQRLVHLDSSGRRSFIPGAQAEEVGCAADDREH